MKSVRILSVLAVTAIVVGSLSGCGSFVKDVSHGIATGVRLTSAGTRLVAAVGKIHGVKQANWTEQLPASGKRPELIVQVFAPGVNESTQSKIIDVVGGELAASVFDGASHELRVQAGDSGSVAYLAWQLDKATRDSELGYLHGLVSASKSPMRLTLRPSADGAAYNRSFELPASLGISARSFFVHFPEVLDIPDVSGAPTTWALPGLSVTGALPPTDVIGLFSLAVGDGPLVGEYKKSADGGFELNWIDNLEDVQTMDMRYTPIDERAVPYAKVKDWPTVVKAVTALQESGSGGFTFSYRALVGNGQVSIGDCDVAQTYLAGQDRSFIKALIAAGVPLKADGSAGSCYQL